MFDVYRNKKDQRERRATRVGAGLPEHVDPADWEIMAPGTSQIIVDAEEDIEARGFCFYKLV